VTLVAAFGNRALGGLHMLARGALSENMSFDKTSQ
jgi:hypothetical protein